MKICVSQTCTLPFSFAEDVASHSEGGATAMEVWLTKLETHLESNSVESTLQLLAERNLTLASAAYHGGLLLSQGLAQDAAFDSLRNRLELCQQFQIPTLLITADYCPKPEISHFPLAAENLKKAAIWAAGYSVDLAFQFRSGETFCTNLETALALVHECAEPNLGICWNAFHYHKGSSKSEDLIKLTKENLKHVQLCDVAGMPRELMTDSDRIFPGEGDFHLGPIIRRLREIEYEKYVALELFHPVLWKSKPTQVVELGLSSIQRLF